MELQILDTATLHFPRREWRWLRHPARNASSPASAPDAFVWAARVGNQLWAWHSRGTDLATDFPGMKMRVLILETDGSEMAAHGLCLKTAFTAQAAQDVEWVAAVQVLTDRMQHLPTEKGLPPHWKEALEACGLEPHLGVLAQRGRYVFLSQDERQLLFDKRWDLATLEMAETLSLGVRADFVAALRKWSLTAAQAKEALGYVAILVRKMGDKTAQNVLKSSHQSAEEFRTGLLRTAQPELATLSQRRIDMLRGLHIPLRTSVYGDPAFEKDVLKITHTPRSMNDFEAFQEWIANPEVAEKIRALLEIYQ